MAEYNHLTSETKLHLIINKMAELEEKITAEEKHLQEVRKQLAEMGELSRKLRVAEKESEEKIFKLKQQVSRPQN